MVDVIADEELAALLGLTVTDALSLIVEKTNLLITENWTESVDPVPTSVWALAVNIATRALSNPKGLSSWTRSWDDVTRTERMEGDALNRLGLYITAEEIATLNGDLDTDDDAPVGVGTIQTKTRAEVCTPWWA